MKKRSIQKPISEPAETSKREMQYREASFEVRADDKGVESVRMSVSSELPVLSYVEYAGQWMFFLGLNEMSVKA